jgi:predicted dehydrogenase
MTTSTISSSQHFGWALVGPGGIAHRFAEAVDRLPGTRLVVVQGRDFARARKFADTWSGPDRAPVEATTDLTAVLARPDVQGVYIATPHAFHASAIRAALEAGKAVLCEKPLVTSAAAARPLIELARERGVLLMEALWTRFLPAYEQVARWLDEGAIGAVRGLQCSFGFHIPFDASSRMYDPAQAGGALLDMGVYNLSMTQWLVGRSLGRPCPEPETVHVQGSMAPTGVDGRVWGMLGFPGGIVAQFTCGTDGVGDNSLRLMGEQGHIVVPRDFWQPTEVQLWRSGSPVEVVQAPFAINGFEGEIEEAMRCARAGLVESPTIPHADTLAVQGWMDTIRGRLGVRYPFESSEQPRL